LSPSNKRQWVEGREDRVGKKGHPRGKSGGEIKKINKRGDGQKRIGSQELQHGTIYGERETKETFPFGENMKRAKWA